MEVIDLTTVRVEITHNDVVEGMVHVEGYSQVGDDVQYDDVLWIVQRIASRFYDRAIRRNRWGCDGIGYMVEKARGRAFENVSTVSARNFKTVIAQIREEFEQSGHR